MISSEISGLDQPHSDASTLRSIRGSAGFVRQKMIKVSVLYPNSEGRTFDISYYCSKHMPLVAQLLGASLKGMNVDEGIGGQTPGTTAPYLAIGHLLFESVEAFQTAFAPHAATIVGDVPNYTDIQPILQISAVKL
jgi:uncharacterized protein (TIGR02118 family)